MTQDLVFVVTINTTGRSVQEWEETLRRELHLAPLDTVRGYPMPEHTFPAPSIHVDDSDIPENHTGDESSRHEENQGLTFG